MKWSKASCTTQRQVSYNHWAEKQLAFTWLKVDYWINNLTLYLHLTSMCYINLSTIRVWLIQQYGTFHWVTWTKNWNLYLYIYPKNRILVHDKFYGFMCCLCLETTNCKCNIQGWLENCFDSFHTSCTLQSVFCWTLAMITQLVNVHLVLTHMYDKCSQSRHIKCQLTYRMTTLIGIV